MNQAPSFGRRDCYKIGLLEGKTSLKYSNRIVETGNKYLFFGNPHIPYASHIHNKLIGYSCLFTEEFLKLQDHRSGNHPHSPLFKLADSAYISVNDQQYDFLCTLFKKIIDEQSTEYPNKGELVRTYLTLIIQEAIKMNSIDTPVKYKNAASRISFLFLELLERQFPIENIGDILKLRTAQNFAEQLNVHVNYLNRSVKETTGKPTTIHIQNRIVSEAQALLQNTDWAISDIAYCLGFEYTTYFNKYFKKHTGAVPGDCRSNYYKD